jgi:hypothetical protein
MAKLFFLPGRSAIDLNGLVVSGAEITFYITGTSIKQSVFANAELTVELTNPVVANAAGRFPSIYLDESKIYRVVGRDPSKGTTLFDVDPYYPGVAAEASDELLAAAAAALAAAALATTEADRAEEAATEGVQNIVAVNAAGAAQLAAIGVAGDAAEASVAAEGTTQIGHATTAANQSLAYRNQAQLLVDGATFAVAYGAITTLAQSSLLGGLTGMTDGAMARVVSTRAGGWWKFHSGNMSAFVTADPYKGLWYPPNSTPSGTSGAWERMVEKGEYDAEWWLPEAMPTQAQLPLNSGILLVPDGSRFLLPRRPVSVYESLRFNKTLNYIGAGHAGRIDGNARAIIAIVIAASGSRLKNIKAGNVQGNLGGSYGEASGFNLYNGSHTYTSDGTVTENVGLDGCETYNAETGLRFGHSSAGANPTTIYPTRECWATDFRCSGVKRIGIEFQRATHIEVRGAKVKMTVPNTISGFDRCMRMAGAKYITVIGGRSVGVNTRGTTGVMGVTYGISTEGGGQGDPANNADFCENVTIEGHTVDNCAAAFRVFGKNITISGCHADGGNDATPRFIEIPEAVQNLKVSGNIATNMQRFATVVGGVSYLVDVTGNTHISNNNTSDTHFFYIANSSMFASTITGNKQIGNGIGASIRALSTANYDITINDNTLTGTMQLVTSVNGKIKTRGPGANEIIDNSLWALVRPDFNKEVYGA